MKKIETGSDAAYDSPRYIQEDAAIESVEGFDPRDVDRLSANVLAAGVRSVRGALLAAERGPRFSFVPSEVKLWSLAWVAAANRMPQPAPGQIHWFDGEEDTNPDGHQHVVSRRAVRMTNFQDGTVIHEGDNDPTLIGEDVVVGHRAVLHGCTVGGGCLIGIQATVLDGCVIGQGSGVGAGAVVPAGMVVPPRSLVLGLPAKVVKTLGEEAEIFHRRRAAKYLLLQHNHRSLEDADGRDHRRSGSERPRLTGKPLDGALPPLLGRTAE